jgi:acetylornithine/succinyldiaminopimelate/putrescine aminotransferase
MDFINHRHSICIESGTGTKVVDPAGKEYIDLTGGFGENCLGFSDAKILKAIKEQSKLITPLSSKHYINSYGAAVQKLLSNGFKKAAITNGASEANASALRLIDKITIKNRKKRHVIVVSDNFPIIDSLDSNLLFEKGPANFPALKRMLKGNVAALIVEPICGLTLTPADYAFMINAYALCKSMDIIFMCDETGFGIGRSGTHFAYQEFGIQPDIVTVSNGLGGGLNLGAVLVRGALSEFLNGVDTSGNTLALAACNAVLNSLDEKMLKDITEKSEHLLGRLYKLKKHNFISDVRGKGLAAAIVLSDKVSAINIVNQMEKAGFLIDYMGDNLIKLTPPFCISISEIDEACDALEGIFAEINI